MHFRSMRPQRTIWPRSRTASTAARSMLCQNLTVAGWAARHSRFECLDFGVGEFVRLEFPKSVQAAHVAEGEIAGLADRALVLRDRCWRDAEDLGCGLK